MPFDGVHAARLMREWRVLYVVDDEELTVTVRSILHRRDACDRTGPSALSIASVNSNCASARAIRES